MDHAHDESHPHVNYLLIFVGLCICTALSVVFDVVEMTPALVVFAVLAVAVAKASLVMTFFMHLKFEGRWKYIILLPTSILGVGLMVALAPDMAMHYYRYDVMQSNIVAPRAEHGAGHEAEEGAEDGSESEVKEAKHH